MVEDWKDGQIGTGVVYYLKAGQVRGVLLWNVWDSVDQARDLIAETGKAAGRGPGVAAGSRSRSADRVS